jgi:hypothetical protein
MTMILSCPCDSYSCVAQWWSPEDASLFSFVHTVLNLRFESGRIRFVGHIEYKRATFDCMAYDQSGLLMPTL